LETSIVRRIAVTDGQKVKRGDLLLELDAVGVGSDRTRAESSLLSAKLNAARYAALAEAYEKNSPPVIQFPAGVTSLQMQDAKHLTYTEFEAYKRKIDGLKAQLAEKQAEQLTVSRSMASAREYASIAADRVSDYRHLLGKNYVSRQEYLVREQERISAERDLTEQESRLKELQESINVARQDLASALSSARGDALDRQRQAREQAAEFESDLAKAYDRRASMRLVSPIDGTVEQLSLHTVGGVITPAQPLLSVVPLDVAAEVEATVLNQDIGFVQVGQRAIVKLETFPYARYGFIGGRVTWVSRDAVSDEKLGLVFPVHVALDKAAISVNGREVNLNAGMALSVEIKTGERSVMSYLLDPLKTGISESFHER
jgi:hemolysin D